jgi:carbonic anhydrase
MRNLSHLFANNRAWVQQMTTHDPRFFHRLAEQQSPELLWIGCSDSRVPANEIIGMPPGEVFVHRNVANLVVHSDLNCLSVLQYGVEALRVKHVIVCGHYHCGGIIAALQKRRLGLIDNWLHHIVEIHEKHEARLNQITDLNEKTKKLCELNVIEQVINVCETPMVQDAWRRGQEVSVHGWIYDVSDGLLKDLRLCVTHPEEMLPLYKKTLQAITATPDE